VAGKIHPPDLTCSEIVELVTGYLEGALSKSDRVAFERHLVWCGMCRDYLDQVRTAITLTGTAEVEEPPSPMREWLVEAFRNWKRNRR
jgi:predicted anti-sigma-YlaC factor YlaD